MVVVIDYGLGNLGSILNMLKRVGASAKISCSLQDIEAASKIILPGVGSFDRGMQNLKELRIIDALSRRVLDQKVPFLGVCLGAQLLTSRSDEGDAKGLGWFDAETRKFQFRDNDKLKVPHMGWNEVRLKKESKILSQVDDELRFYFVHSYFMHANNRDDVVGETTYGAPFASALERDNICALQFHPEKSHKFGMQAFKRFVGAA